MSAELLPPTPDNLGRAAAALRDGKLVAFPTETVYGLGGDATNDRAVAAIYAAKGRPSFNPLIVHVGDLAQAAEFASISPEAEELARCFWPGALTLVLPRRPGTAISLLVSGGRDSVAVRVPAHPAAQSLLSMARLPLAAPSANPSGKISPTRAEHVVASLGDKVALIIDGGPCRIGVESTVVSLLAARPRILRPGGITAEQLAEAIGAGIDVGSATNERDPRSPGQMESHYAPGLPVRLDAISVSPGEALLAFGPNPPVADLALNLSPAGDPVEAAANLFAMLRALDRPGLTGIAVSPIPESGLGAAINDRLRRAAAPR